MFGHIADGNLHIFVRPHKDGAHHDKSDEIVYGSLYGLSGSLPNTASVWRKKGGPETAVTIMKFR